MPDALEIDIGDAPGAEYMVFGSAMSMGMNQFISMFRYSMGDFEYGWLGMVPRYKTEIAYIYWVIWFM